MKIGHSTNKEELLPYWAAIEPDVPPRGRVLSIYNEVGRAMLAEEWTTEIFGPGSYHPDARWNRIGTRFWFKSEEDLLLFMLRFG